MGDRYPRAEWRRRGFNLLQTESVNWSVGVSCIPDRGIDDDGSADEAAAIRPLEQEPDLFEQANKEETLELYEEEVAARNREALLHRGNRIWAIRLMPACPSGLTGI